MQAPQGANEPADGIVGETAVPIVRPRFDRIVAATDLSAIGNQAVAHAFAVAPAHAEIVIVHVLSPNLLDQGRYGRPAHPDFARIHARVLADRRACLEKLVADLRGDGDNPVRIELIESDRTHRALLEAIEREAPDLICAGTIGRTGLGAALLGSNAQALLRDTRRPLLLVQPQD